MISPRPLRRLPRDATLAALLASLVAAASPGCGSDQESTPGTGGAATTSTNSSRASTAASGSGGGGASAAASSSSGVGGVTTMPVTSGGSDSDPPCDSGLALDSVDPLDAAKAIGICRYVTSAKWVLADGSPPPPAIPAIVPSPPDQCGTYAPGATQEQNFHLGHGILDGFGPNLPPREGASMLALSSGAARRADQPGFAHVSFDKGYTSNSPAGFPKESSTCPGITTKEPHDATGLEVLIQPPSNVIGFSFDFDFFTYEWPEFICSDFNDFFVSILSPTPSGQSDGNISFDAQMNPISVNNAFLGACGCPVGPPCSAPPVLMTKSFSCNLGLAPLQGTDFLTDDLETGWSHASTGWLRTTAPIAPGASFTIRFVSYDSSDGCYDSLTLVDNWIWLTT